MSTYVYISYKSNPTVSVEKKGFQSHWATHHHGMALEMPCFPYGFLSHGGTPQIDGFFHGKSQRKMDDLIFTGYPPLETSKYIDRIMANHQTVG